MKSRQIITAPNGSLIRAEHIVSISPLFESVELGTDAFAVYTVGDNSDPFVFAALDQGSGPKAAAKRKAETAEARQKFVNDWIFAVDLFPAFESNN